MAENPHAKLASAEAEAAVIGGLFVAPERFHEVSATLGPDDFTVSLHAKVFAEMADMDAAGIGLEFITLAERLEDKSQLGPNDFAAIGVIVRDTLSSANLLPLAKSVKSRSTRRKLAKIGARLQQWALQETDPEKIHNRLQAELEALDAGRAAGGLVHVKAVVGEVVEDLDALAAGGKPPGYEAGLADLDKMTGGVMPGDLILIGGRPSMGKSTLGLQIAGHIAAKTRKPAADFTVEMPNKQQVRRMLSSYGRIDLQKLKTGQLDDADWSHVTDAVAAVSALPLYFDESGDLTISDLLSRARRLHRQHGGLSCVIVDHAGLVDAAGDTRQQEQAAVSKSLKKLAKELRCPVIALVQLNRALEQRGDKRPVMSDLRESGTWEQDADLIWFIYRDEIYDPESPDKGCAELIIRKQRDGELGTVALAFIGHHARFESLAGGLPSWRAPKVVAMSRARGLDL